MNGKYSEDKLPDPDSKSQRKRDMTALQDLGEELTGLPDTVLARLELPGFLTEAIQAYKDLPKSHGAQRRQIKYIGKVMRDLDDELIERLNTQIFENVTLAKRRFHNLELLRDRLLEGGKEELAAYVSEHPDTDIQLFNQLIRQAKKELEKQAPPAAARRLFQLIRDQEKSDQA